MTWLVCEDSDGGAHIVPADRVAVSLKDDLLLAQVPPGLGGVPESYDVPAPFEDMTVIACAETWASAMRALIDHTHAKLTWTPIVCGRT